MSVRRLIEARCWLDADGIHIWLGHECTTGERPNIMLPWPTWHATQDGRVEPSIVCQDCDLHLVLARIEEPPIGWRGAAT